MYEKHKNELYANLHTHSTHSDGKLTPMELALAAKAEGYKALAITDHDTATAFSELSSACKEVGIECIFGVEFSTRVPEFNTDCHLVGFNFDPEYRPIREYLNGMEKRETAITKIVFDRATVRGTLTGITWDEVMEYNQGIAWICNEHIFRAMKAKGIATDADYPDFFNTNFYGWWTWIDEAIKDKDIAREKPLSELCGLIHDAGGIAIVAHPVGKRIDLLGNFHAMGVDGFEVWHAEMSEQERVKAYNYCIENGLYISGGSDHSGLCSGLYSSYSEPERSPYYIEPMSSGTTEHFFREIKNMKIDRRKVDKNVFAAEFGLL